MDEPALFLTLDDGVITTYSAVDDDGMPSGDVDNISLAHLRGVVIEGLEMRIITPERTWRLNVVRWRCSFCFIFFFLSVFLTLQLHVRGTQSSEEEAREWAALVEEASELWAVREARSSTIKAMNRGWLCCCCCLSFLHLPSSPHPLSPPPLLS